MIRRGLALLLCATVAACSGSIAGPDPDSGATPLGDAGTSPPDSGASPLDAGKSDAGSSDASASDAGPVDLGILDSGAPDLGPADTGTSGCLDTDAGLLSPTGATHPLAPGDTLAAVLGAAAPGDRVVVQGGSYPAETLTNSFASPVWIEAAAGATPIFHGLTLNGAGQLIFRGIHFDGTVTLQAAHDLVFDQIDLDVGARDVSGLEIFNSRGATHDVLVMRSRIAGGARTIFFGGRFGLEVTWNHHVQFRDNELICGTHNCFQLSGGRDVIIEDNDFHDPQGAGVLTAGATRIVIARNRMRGGGVMAPAIQLATPGKEWDNYAGVEYMISSDITVANNLIVGWGGSGIELDAVRDVKIVYNTIASGAGLHTWARTPHDQQDNVILSGNHEVKLWNNILTSISLDAADPRPMLESNNLVERGGGGQNLYTGAASYDDQLSFVPQAGSPAIDHAMIDALTPLVDQRGSVRGPRPDIGAVEREGQVCR